MTLGKKSLLKTLWEKEKMLQAAFHIFSLSFLLHQGQSLPLNSLSTLYRFMTKFCPPTNSNLTVYHLLNVDEFMKSDSKSLESIVGKGENVGHQQFLPFPQCF